ncbi:MAG: TlpA disulfide reductase family protein [Flavobacteriaceae bacterium]
MKISKKTILNIVMMLFILSFFVTPLGYQGKLLLNNLFSRTPEFVSKPNRKVIENYDWRLKDEDWNFFSFERSKGRVAIIVFWASWKLPACEAEMKSIEKLYRDYKGKVDFYLISNEERPPVELFVEEHGITAPITYLIIGDKSPINIPKPCASYILDKNGGIAAYTEGVSDWNTSKTRTFLDTLIAD